MKKLNVIICMLISAFFVSSCSEMTCDGSGTLKLTNDSHSTVQQILIDGVNYGSLDPGESDEISLPPGEHDWQLVGLSGGTGCSAATVIIVECEVSGYSCGG
jgi:hypothetical protein